MIPEKTWLKHLQANHPQVDLGNDTFFDPHTRQILTTDMLVEGVHFSLDYFSPEDIGWRAIACNLSDIAATGGVPKWILVSLGLPEKTELAFIESLYAGIQTCCDTYRCTLVGGDTVYSPQLTLSITVVGMLPQGHLPGRRNNCQPGDWIMISAPHGLSYTGYQVLKERMSGYDVAKKSHLRPEPQLKLGQNISKTLPRFAMMDSSDGLADAVMALAEASQVDIVIESKRLIIHPEVQQLAETLQRDPLEAILYGGEDFQLVVSIPSETIGLFPQLCPIGVVQDVIHLGHGQAFIQQAGKQALLEAQKTFQHFQPREDVFA